MNRKFRVVGTFVMLSILAACSREPAATTVQPVDPGLIAKTSPPAVTGGLTNLARFNGKPPGDLLGDQQIGRLIRSLVPQEHYKCLAEAMEWMPDLELASDGSLGTNQIGSRADDFRETYLSIHANGSFDMVLLCQIDAPGAPKGKYQHFTNNADLKSPSKAVQEWLYIVGRPGDIISVSDGKHITDIPFDAFVAALSAGAAAPTERQASAAPAHVPVDAKAGPELGSGQAVNGMLSSIIETLSKPFLNNSIEKGDAPLNLQYAGVAKTMLRTQVRHPDSLEVSNIVVRYEDGSARILAVTFSASNSYGVRDTHAALLSFRINGSKIWYPSKGGVITGNTPTGNAQEDRYFSPYHIDIDLNIRMFKNEWSEAAMSR